LLPPGVLDRRHGAEMSGTRHENHVPRQDPSPKATVNKTKLHLRIALHSYHPCSPSLRAQHEAPRAHVRATPPLLPRHPSPRRQSTSPSPTTRGST